MASAEQLLISKILETRSVEQVINAGLRPDHFNSELSVIYKWILDYWREYGEVPTDRVLKQEYADLKLPNAELEPMARLIDELYEAYRNMQLTMAVQAASPALSNQDTDEAIRVLSDALQKAALEVAHLRDVNIIETWEERINRYKERQANPDSFLGVPTGIRGLDLLTSGFRKQQFINIVGEAKKGKSLITLAMSITAHDHGLSPLYVSFEMSADEQTARYDALISGVSHSRILRGDLSMAELDKIEKAIKIRKNMHPFHMTEDSSSLTTLSALSAKINQYRPGIVIVDGVYLMDDEQGEPKNSPQALTNITRGLKRLAQRFDVPIVGTTQVLSWKLGNKKTRQISADAIGYTSSFAQDSDLILGVESDPDIDNQAIIRVVLARSASKGQVRIKWDWEKMDFTEVGEDGENDNNSGWYY
jgi:replicative DNA helicase